MSNQLKARVPHQVADVVFGPSMEVINADNLPASRYVAVTEVAANEASPAGNENPRSAKSI
jgi:hypothetical protein